MSSNDSILVGDKPSEIKVEAASVGRVDIVYSENAEPAPSLADVDSAYGDLKSCDADYIDGPFRQLAISPETPINH